MAFYKPNDLDNRLTALPTGRPDLWAMYERAQESFWTPKEIRLYDDRTHFATRLTDAQRRSVEFILMFFAVGDQLVNVNIIEYFKAKMPVRDIAYFYDFQVMIENQHAETYALAVEAIKPGAREQLQLMNAWRNIPSINAMCKWLEEVIDADEGRFSLGRALIKQACVEGIFFTSCFCVIYWLRSLGLMPGLGQSNALIARDECMHTDYGLYLFRHFLLPDAQIQDAEITEIVVAAVDIASAFCDDMLAIDQAEMNKSLMRQYIRRVADCFLVKLSIEPWYCVAQPFAFMEQINVGNRDCFFEAVPTAYAHKSSVELPQLAFSDDF